MSTFNQVLDNLKVRRERIIKGLYNCIPLPFPRFRRWVPGIEAAKFIIVTANQKVGKSKFCDYLFVYEPLFFLLEHPELRVKVLYFTLEMSPEEKYNEFLCHLLYRLDNIVVSPSQLKSTDKEHPISESVLSLLETEKYQKYIKAFEEMVEYIEDVKNPTGINKYCRDYALSHGHLNFKRGKKKDPITDKFIDADIIDSSNPYTPDDPEERRIIIIDNASNLSLESGLKKMETIDKMSKYGISLRNQLKFIFVLIQHQAQSQEGIENQKMNKLKPSPDGVADCRTTVRDADLVIGLYSPFKYGIRDYEGYDITKFRNNIRFMEVLEDRNYGANGQICPLFFNGASSMFYELPKPNEIEKLKSVYNYIEKLKEEDNNTKNEKLLLAYGKKRVKILSTLYRLRKQLKHNI